jgi:hypothetical protein
VLTLSREAFCNPFQLFERSVYTNLGSEESSVVTAVGRLL